MQIDGEQLHYHHAKVPGCWNRWFRWIRVGLLRDADGQTLSFYVDVALNDRCRRLLRIHTIAARTVRRQRLLAL